MKERECRIHLNPRKRLWLKKNLEMIQLFKGDEGKHKELRSSYDRSTNKWPSLATQMQVSGWANREPFSHDSTGERLAQKSVCLKLSSFTICSQAARRPRRAVMWFRCLGPCGTVPSGKPLRPCCHISPPIISSRSALLFPPHFPFPLLPAPRPLPALICLRLLHLCSPTATYTF